MLIFPIETISKPSLRKGILNLTPYPIEFESGLTEVVEVRVTPKNYCYITEIVYNQDYLPLKQTDSIAGADLGLENLIALTTNQNCRLCL